MIKTFIQIKDGGEGDDSFPSWGLEVEEKKKNSLISQQPYESSHWLGRFLARWAGVEFIENPKENKRAQNKPLQPTG